MKRKIRLSALVAVMVLMLALLIGGLYGYFGDTEESTGNTFTAGTLNLVVVTAGDATCNFTATPGGDGLNGFVVFENVAPGDSGYIEWTLTGPAIAWRVIEPPLMITHDVGLWNKAFGSTTKMPTRPLRKA